jgi:ADP-heptose:LPS heptosyltransferase
VIAYPALLALKRAPHIRHLRLVTTPSVQPFAEVLGVFDEILVIRDESLTALFAGACRAIYKLFRTDVIVDFEPYSRLTTVFSLLTCAQNRVGFFTTISFWRRRLATHLLFFNVTSPVYQFYDQIASLFSAKVEPFEVCIGQFQSYLQMQLRTGRPRSIAVAPCCSDLARTRMLLRHEWATVIERHLALPHVPKDLQIDLLAGPSQREEVEGIRSAICQKFPSLKVVNHAGETDLRGSLGIISGADLLLGIDSALLHCARLLGVRTVSYWGPTAPETLLRPAAPGYDVVHYQKLSCSPCVHLADRPPCNGNNICMRLAVEPDRPDDRSPCWVAN